MLDLYNLPTIPLIVLYLESMESSFSSVSEGGAYKYNLIPNLTAFGEDYVREVVNSRKEYILHWAAKETYPFDDEDTLTAAELKTMLGERNVYLSNLKQRYHDYKNSKTTATNAKEPAVVAKNLVDDDWDF